MSVVTQEVYDEDKLIDESFEFIKRFEWFNPKRYEDFHHYSIGYWTTSHSPNETLTEKEARNLAKNKIRKIIRYVDIKQYQPKYRIALISFFYNAWEYWKDEIKRLAKNWDDEWLKNILSQWIHSCKRLQWKPNECIKMDGLVTRRAEEIKLFYNI